MPTVIGSPKVEVFGAAMRSILLLAARMKILVLRFSSIGDIVLTSPVLRCLKQQGKEMELHVAVKSVFADLVRFNPHVDKVHELGDDLGELIKRLKTEDFDEVIDLHHNLRTARIKRALNVPSHSFPKLNIEKWLLVNAKGSKPPWWSPVARLWWEWKQPRLARMEGVHIVDRYMSTVEHLGVKNDGQGLELFIPPAREVSLSSLPEAHRNGYTALAIGAAHTTKRLPQHKLIELAQLVPGPIVIIGGKEDQAVARAIASEVGGRIFDATGQYDILGSASLIKQARNVIAHDSGAMHIACAFKKNVVSIWGNTVPAFGMGPYIPQQPERAHIAEVLGLDCRPCSKIGHDRCPQGHFRCMEKQDLRWITEKACT